MVSFCFFKGPLVQLTCGQDKLQVGLDLNNTQSSDLDPFSGHFAARNCSRFKVQGDVVWYEVEARAGACGNIVTVKIFPFLLCVLDSYLVTITLSSQSVKLRDHYLCYLVGSLVENKIADYSCNLNELGQ